MTPGGRQVVLVAAVARNGVIGDTRPGRPDIPWRLPGEQAQFKELTLGHVLVMGRATYDTIGRPLPGRTTVVLTRDRAWPVPDGVHAAGSLDEALVLADRLAEALGPPERQVHVVGGAQVYAAALPAADVQVVTEVPLEPDGDVRYPGWPLDGPGRGPGEGGWVEVSRERFEHWDRVRLERRTERTGDA